MAAGGTPQQLHTLREAIDGLELAVHGDVIAEARELHDRLDAVICAAEAEYTKTGLAEVEGFANVAAFERHRCHMTLPRSRRVARRAARVAAWSELGAAWRDGRLSGAQVELACAVVPDRHVERFAETIDDTIEILASLNAHQTGVVLRRWVRCADDLAEREAAELGIEPAEVIPARELSASRTLDDELVVNGFIDTDGAPYVEAALTAATRDDLPGETRTPRQRRADALITICQHYLDTHTSDGGNRRTERLTITADIVTLYRAWLRASNVVTADDLEQFLAARPGLGELDRGLFHLAFDRHGDLATTLDGNPITNNLLTAVATGGAMELLLHAEGRILHHGRTLRSFTPTQRRAVLTRDQGCRTCGADPSTCDIHHVTPWDQGGLTDIDNAIALCRRCHHHLLHRRNWTNHIQPDGTYTIDPGNGTTHTTPPPGLGAQIPPLPVATSSKPARTPPKENPPFLIIRVPSWPRRHRTERPGSSRRHLGDYSDFHIGDLRIDSSPSP